MPEYKIIASLPYPLRINPSPYEITTGSSIWSITVERVPREYPDERIAGPGTDADLLVDRGGQLAYSRVTGIVTLDGNSRSALSSFVSAINVLVRHVRDVFEEYWIRPLEVDDLYHVHVLGLDSGTTHFVTGRGRGLTLPVIGRTEEANERLLTALTSGKAPPIWRQMHLDARDALDQGRYEDCVILTWSALEAACRLALPGMAYRAGLTVDQFANLVDAQNNRLKHAISYEEVLEKTSGGLKLVNAAAELTQPHFYILIR